MTITISKSVVNDDDLVKGAMYPLFVGFEFEFDASGEQDRKVREFMKSKFGITKGEHSRGNTITTKTMKIGGADIRICVPEDRYKGAGLVTDYYVDGSVNSEIVTRPVPIEKLWIIEEELFKPLRELGVDFVANGKAGLHMTFLNDYHKELSQFKPLHIQNMLQLGRFFFVDLVNMKWSETDDKTRPLRYRRIFSGSGLQTLETEHYTFFSVRGETDESGNQIRDEKGRRKVWALEIRLPDGTNKWDEVVEQVNFYNAFFKMAWETSQIGRFHFSQNDWNRILEWVSDFDNKTMRETRVSKGRGINKMLLTKMISPYLPREYSPVGHLNTWVEWNNKKELAEGVSPSPNQ